MQDFGREILILVDVVFLSRWVLKIVLLGPGSGGGAGGLEAWRPGGLEAWRPGGRSVSSPVGSGRQQPWCHLTLCFPSKPDGSLNDPLSTSESLRGNEHNKQNGIESGFITRYSFPQTMEDAVEADTSSRPQPIHP